MVTFDKINALGDTAARVSSQLDESATQYERLVEGQEKGIAQQEIMLASSMKYVVLL